MPTNQMASCQVMFSSAVTYTAEVLNVTTTSCTLRSTPFRQGVAIYDPALLDLEFRGIKISIVGTLECVETYDSCATPKKAILATFVYPELDKANQQWVQEYHAIKSGAELTDTVKSVA